MINDNTSDKKRLANYQFKIEAIEKLFELRPARQNCNKTQQTDKTAI